MKIMDIGEKELIKSLIRPLFEDKKLEVCVGDDAAVINLNRFQSLVLTTDKISEHLAAHTIGLMDYYDIGRYLIVANLSDIAAMGGKAIALLTALSLPKEFELDNLKKLIGGIKDTASVYKVPVVGGDTKNGSGISLVATAVGIVQPGKSLKRKGAKPGDVIYATGSPGTFSTALAYLLNAKPLGMELDDLYEKILIEKLIKPKAALEEAQELVGLGVVHSCQDISDGVGQTIYEIAMISEIGFEVNTRLIEKASPKPLKEIAIFCNLPPELIMLGPGADFDLIFSVASDNCHIVEKAFKEKDWALHKLGRFIENGYYIVNRDGERTQMQQTGWQHFLASTDIQALKSSFK